MNIIQWVNTAVIIIGLPLILKTALHIGKELELLHSIDDQIRNEIRPALKELRERVFEIEKKLAVLESKVNVMWEWFSKHIILSETSGVASLK